MHPKPQPSAPEHDPIEARSSLQQQYRDALAEVERLSVPDDLGVGQRTARLAGLGPWQAEADRLEALLSEPNDESSDEAGEGALRA